MSLRHYYRLIGVWVLPWMLLMYAACSEVATNHPDAVEERCEVCHDMPPQDSTTELMVHFIHSIYDGLQLNNEEGLQCWQCHLNCDTIIVKSTIEKINPISKAVDVKDTLLPVLVWNQDLNHRNGKLDLDTNSIQCRLCHDYKKKGCDTRECHGVPPEDVINPPSKGVHSVHFTRNGFGCDSCHKGYDPETKSFPLVRTNGTLETTHDNGEINVVFNIMRNGDYPDPFFSLSNYTCNNVYCHGAWVLGGKSSVSVDDIMGQDSTKCSFCHDIDVLRENGSTHSIPGMADLFPDCLNCHEGYNIKTLATNALTHRNGEVNTISCEKCDECHTPEKYACDR